MAPDPTLTNTDRSAENSPLRLANSLVWLCAAIGALAPMLPLYLQMLGMSGGQIAFLLAVQAGGALLFAQFFGYIADRFFRRTSILMVTTLLAVLTQALFPFIPGELLYLAIGMALLATFMSPRLGLINALLFESPRGEELYGRIRLTGSLSFVAAVLIVGALADLPLFTVAIMWPVLIIIELLFALSVTALRDQPPGQRRGSAGLRVGFVAAQGQLLGDPLLRRFLFFVFLTQVIAGPTHFLQMPLLNDLGASTLFAMACVGVAALAETIIFFFAGPIIRRFPMMLLFAIPPVALAIRLGLIALFPDPWVILAVNSLHMFTFGLSYLTCVIFMNRHVPAELRSSGQTLLGITYSTLSMLLGNLVAAGLLAGLAWFGLGSIIASQAYFAVGALVAAASLLALKPMACELALRESTPP